MRRVFRLPFSARRLARDVDDEIAFHLATRVDRLVAGGLTPDEARREALRQFGDLPAVRRSMLTLSRQREATAHRVMILSDLRQDLAFGIRTLRRGTGFTALVVGSLALGIGANATIFSLIDALLLRPLPVTKPNELVAVGDPENVTASGCCSPSAVLFSYPLYLDIRDHNDVFTGVLAAGGARRLAVRVERRQPEPEHPAARFVSGNYFRVLGVPPAIGGTLGPNDDAIGAPPRATISDSYWRRRFSADSSVVGRTITVNGVGVVVTGVTPRGFTGEVVGGATDIWLPLAAQDVLRPNEKLLGDRGMSWLLLMGRAKPGLTLAQVKQRLVPVIEASIMANATSGQLVRLRARGLKYYVSSGEHGLSSVRPAFTSPLIALMAGVAMLLGIVCVNVANLLLARGIARRREMLARLAIGASRWRIVRQLLAEGFLLAVVSATAAVAVAWWGSRALVALASEGEPISLDVGPNPRVLAFTVALAMVSVMLFGLVPALRSSRVDLATAMRAHARSIAQGARFGLWLIAVQVAISLVLVTGASMLTRGLRAAESLDLGLDRDHLIVADLDITTPGYSGDRLAVSVRTVRDRVMQVPGVTHVTYSENGLFSGTEWHSSVGVPGFTPRTDEDSSVATDNVGAGYASGIGARIVAGRDFTFSDEGVLPRVAMVSAPFARFYFPGRSAVGQVFRVNDSTHLTIVGVIGDMRGQALEPPAPRTARRVYMPYLHPRDPGHLGQPSELRLFVRTRGDPAPIVEAVRRAILSADPALPVNHVRPLSSLVRASIRQERLVVRIATALGVLALSLAAIGLYGVAAYMGAQRTGELGLRRALGAPARAVAGVVARHIVRPVALGAALGVLPALAMMRILERQLSVATPDAGAMAIALAVLVASAVVAGLAPAMRAARVDPVVALRSE